MGCPLLMFRPLASLILGALAFLAFFAYLFFNLADGHILSADFYADALSEQQVYSRIYDEVLVDPELEDTTRELLGNVEVPQEDVADVAKRIMGPDYLQQETERNLDGLVDYLKQDIDNLDLYIELAQPLDNASMELVAYVNTRIDDIRLEPVEPVEVGASQEDEGKKDEAEAPGDSGITTADADELAQQTLEQVQEAGVIRIEQVELETDEEWTDYWERTVIELDRGQLPSQLPSLAGVDVETRLDSYDMALEELRQTDDVAAEVLDALQEPETDSAIREALSNEDPYQEEDVIKQVLKAASSGVLPPLIDDTLDDVRRELVTPDGTVCEDLPADADLSACTRYDLLASVDEDLESNEGLNSTRDSIKLFGALGSWLPIVVLIGACLLIVVVNLPRVVSILRWLGIVLAFTGLFFLIAGILMGGTISGRLDSGMQDVLEDADVPPSVSVIASDVTSHMADVLSQTLTSPSLTLMVVGLVLFGLSLFILRIPIVRRIPFISSLLVVESVVPFV